MVDLYNNRQRYATMMQSLEELEIIPENEAAVNRYISEQIDNLQPGSRARDLVVLKRVFYGRTGSRDSETGSYLVGERPFIRQPLSALTLDDWRKIDSEIKAQGFSRDYYKKITNHIRRLYELTFENSKEQHHQAIITSFSRTGRRAFFQYSAETLDNESVGKERFYTFDEYKELIRTARRAQEKALLAVAWETTARPNEYLTLSVGDVEPLPTGFLIKAHISKKKGGRTLTRNLYVITFRAEFSAFWNAHPFKNDPKAPLFYREDNKAYFGRRLGPAGANKMLKTIDFRSGIKKNGTLYYLRHGGYTWKKAEGMKDALAGKDMGWVAGSRQARRYEHLQDEDLLQERMRLADERFEQEIKPKLKVKICPFCNQENSPVDEMCKACGQELSMKEITRRFEQERLARMKLESQLDRQRREIDAQMAAIRETFAAEIERYSQIVIAKIAK